jgi:hypothetical protein
MITKTASKVNDSAVVLDGIERNNSPGNKTLDYALDAHSRGWSVIPIKPGTKEPLGKWKAYQTIRADEEQLHAWFPDGTDAGMAIIFGEVSGGLCCRDYDEQSSYDRWAADHPDLAGTLPTVKTPRGRHVYCRCDTSQIRQASTSGSGGVIDFDDGELRGDGAYCVAPPSRHQDGSEYEWLIAPSGEVPFVDLENSGFLNSGRATERTDDRAVSAVCALSTQWRSEIQKAIQKALPTEFRQRHLLVFQFCRELKAIPGLADATPNDLRPYVREWYDLGKAFITSSFTETLTDFAESWGKVKYAAGEGPVDDAFAKMLENELPRCTADLDEPRVQLLAGLCRELQRMAGTDQPFYLACRIAAEKLEAAQPKATDHSTVARWLKFLTNLGILRLVEKGSQKSGRASRYQYVADDL